MVERAIIAVILAFLAGSIPFSQLIASWRTGLDLREVGEGNAGSRNVWHVAGPVWGVISALLDALKGYAVCLAVGAFVSPTVALVAGVAAVLGHQFSIFLRGRGGKGLATALGVILYLSPLSTLCALVILGLARLILRDFNHALIVGVIAIILLPLVFRQPPQVAAYALGLAVLTGLKKLLDRPRESRVWSERPWEGAAVPGWQRPAGGLPTPGDTPPPEARS